MGYRRSKQDQKISNEQSKMAITKKRGKYIREKKEKWNLKKD